MKLRHLTISGMALILMSACTDATGLEPVDLEGTWTATSMAFTSVENSELTADLVAEGATLTLVLDVTGEFILTLTKPQVENEVDTGTYLVDGDILMLSDSIEETSDEFTVARDGDTLTLTIPDEFEFAPDVVEAATLVITLTR